MLEAVLEGLLEPVFHVLLILPGHLIWTRALGRAENELMALFSGLAFWGVLILAVFGSWQWLSAN